MNNAVYENPNNDADNEITDYEHFTFDCYGFECNRNATSKITVNAGRFGNISLYLCSLCVSKFQKPENKK